MTTNKHTMLDDNYDWNRHNQAIADLEDDGFVQLPDWFPSGGYREDIYEYKIVGGIDAMVKPRPLFRHWLRFRLAEMLTPEFIKRRKVRKWLKANFEDLNQRII